MKELIVDFVTGTGGPVVLVTLMLTSIWAIYTYARARRNERAQWLHQLFNDVYFSDRFTGIKNTIEYGYEDYLAPLLELRMNDRHVQITSEDVNNLDQLDNFLNYIEHVLGLESRGLMSRRERLIVFDYWPNIIGQNESFAALRRYISMCGYELINKELGLENVDYVALYGSLMRGLGPPHQPDFSGDLEYAGTVLLPGSLYLVNEGQYPYPGLVLTSENQDRILHPSRRSKKIKDLGQQRKSCAVRGELYRVQDASVFERLDEWEEYSAGDRAGSPYIRRMIRVLEPEVDAWVYIGNHANQSVLLSDLDWRSYTESIVDNSRSDDAQRLLQPE